MNRFTVEETNLLSIYAEDSKRALLENIIFHTEDKKRCTVCEISFTSKSNSIKYCPDCRKHITQPQAAERMRKRRTHVTEQTQKKA